MQHKILLLVREHTRHHINGCHIRRHLLPHEEHNTRHIVAEMQFTGLDVNIAGQDIIQNNILDESCLIVLFIIEGFDIIDGNRNQRADTARQLVLTLHKYRIFQSTGTVTCCVVGLSLIHILI